MIAFRIVDLFQVGVAIHIFAVSLLMERDKTMIEHSKLGEFSVLHIQEF